MPDCDFQLLCLVQDTDVAECTTAAMSVPWLKNHLGFELTQEQMSDIPYPYVELYTHVTIKTVQAFGMLGTLVVGPVAALTRSKTRTLAGINSTACKCGKWGVMLAFVAGPLMTNAVLKSKKATPESVYDRCYRLRYNRGQVRVDRGSAVGAISGAALALPMSASPVMGALVGMSAGIISMAVYSYAFLPKK